MNGCAGWLRGFGDRCKTRFGTGLIKAAEAVRVHLKPLPVRMKQAETAQQGAPLSLEVSGPAELLRPVALRSHMGISGGLLHGCSSGAYLVIHVD